MGFLAPWFLAGLAAIGLPFWIHLLRQYRSTPHPFSSLMFFERRTQSSIKHRRLRYLLLLSLRVALLLLIALAFANPFVTRAPTAAGGPKMLVIAVDNSFSMRYDDHLARAKQQAMNALSQLQPGERAQVLAIGSRVHFLTQPIEETDQLKAAIQGIRPSDDQSSYGEFARALRRHPTRAEDILWTQLRGSRFEGAKFRRQVPIDRYVVDFYCHAAKLVVELDGKQHEWFADSDSGRTEILERLGIRVIRFTNDEVCNDLDAVLARIRAELRLPFD